MKHFLNSLQTIRSSKNLDAFSFGLKTIFALSILLTALSVFAQDTLWMRRLDMGSDEVAQGIGCRSNDIAVVGYRFGSSNNDWLVVKCNQQGETLWTRTFDSGYDDYAADASFDSAQNIIVTGYAYPYDQANTPNGRCWNHIAGLPKKVLCPWLDADQDVYAYTIKYDSLGGIKWQRTEVDKAGIGITTDNDGNSYVSGLFYNGYGYDFWLAKYDPNGDTLWSKTFDFSLVDLLYRNTIDNDGNIVVSGFTGNGHTFDCSLLKFTPQGDTIWTRFFDLNYDDRAAGVAIDQENNIVMTGITGDTSNYDCLILKYDTNGNLIWSRTYNQANDDEALGVTCDTNDNIFLTGVTGEMFFYDYLTIKYDSAGNVLWSATYDNGNDDEGSDVTCDGQGNPIVAGGSYGTLDYDFLTIKYRGANGIEEAKYVNPDFHNAFHVSSIVGRKSIIFNAPYSGYFKLKLYNLAGVLEEEIYRGYLSPGAHRFPLSSLSPGVHFVKVESNDKTSEHKLILVK
jgi:hypothetical protein